MASKVPAPVPVPAPAPVPVPANMSEALYADAVTLERNGNAVHEGTNGSDGDENSGESSSSSSSSSSSDSNSSGSDESSDEDEDDGGRGECRGEKRARRRALGSTMCDICGEQASKYRCPACDSLWCSLDCSRQHRAKDSCDGRLKRSKFVHLREMDADLMLQDIQFLDQVAATCYSTRTSQAGQSSGNQSKTLSKPRLPRRLDRLAKAAASRHTTVTFMPRGMTRATQNTSFFNIKEDTIYWRVEWSLTGSPETESKRGVLKRVSEKQTLVEILRLALPHETGHSHENSTVELVSIAGGAATQREPMDVKLTLGEALANKTIVEFPSFALLLGDPPTSSAAAASEVK